MIVTAASCLSVAKFYSQGEQFVRADVYGVVTNFYNSSRDHWNVNY